MFEQPNIENDQEQIEELPLTRPELVIKMKIQQRLIIDTIQPGEDLDAHAMKWADGEMAPLYAQTFQRIKKRHPRLVQEWEEHPEAIIEEIESEILPHIKKAA